jgi:zinc protease
MRSITRPLGLLLALWIWATPGLALAAPVQPAPQPATQSTAQPIIPRHYSDLRFPALPELRLPNYSRTQLANGMVVYLIEDHELPLVEGTALIRTGSRIEPADQIGLAAITGDLMRSGGTQKYPPRELAQLLEDRAASIETGIGESSGSASFSSLSADLPIVFEQFAAVLRQPAFDPAQLDLTLAQVNSGIGRRNDDPDAIANREFEKLIYGPRSPYARTAEYSTIAKIDRPSVLRFYNESVAPNRIILGIVGDFDSKVMTQLIETAFGDWRSNTAPLPPLPSVAPHKRGGIYIVDQEKLNQSSVLIGQLGGLASDPSYPALDVLNGVLNGFGGRLHNEIRSRQGLAYSVYGSWSPRYDYPGLFISGAQTRSETTVTLVTALRQELDKIRNAPVSPAELAYAKESTLNSFVFSVQEPSQTLSRLMRYEYFGYPKDFLFRYRKAIEATTAEQVQAAAQKFLKPEQFVTLIVGNRKVLAPDLAKLKQPIEAIDITIPAAPVKASPKGAGSPPRPTGASTGTGR